MVDNSINNDPVVVEDSVVDIDSDTHGVSGGGSNNNVKYITIGASVVISFLIYFLMFSGGSKEDSVDTNEIVRDTKALTATSGTIDNIDNLVSIDYNDTNYGSEDERRLLELPELPDLPSNITQDIEQEIKDVKKKDLPDNVFTKEEVDEMIGSKLKNFEIEMNKIKNESEKLAKELERKKIEEEESKKKKKFASILGNDSEIAPPVGGATQSNDTNSGGGLPPNVAGESAEDLEEKKKEEERQLLIAQRARVMQERKSSQMFKMQGGGGGDGKDAEQDSIIITDKDSLQNVEETQTNAVATKTADLTRTVLQGKMMVAILESAINTDVQSQVRAIISRDVYSGSGKNILIPKGSVVIGSYQSVSSTTIARLDIVWNRIIRVDGLNISINSTVADNLGRGGVEGELDNKYTQIIKNAFLSSVVSIATAALVDKITDTVTTTSTSDTSTTTTTNATNTAIIDATQTFGDEIQSIADNLKEETPTIRISQGTKINIVVNQDLVLPIYKQKK